MKLVATIAETDVAVEIRREADRVFARVRDAEYELRVQAAGNGSYLLAWKGSIFDCRVEGLPGSGQPVDVLVGTEQLAVTVADPKRLRGAHSAIDHADKAARIIAPMPGKVVRILVQAGAEIEAGAGIIVVEAMKMQNEMKSPKAGRVAGISVEVGAIVNGGDVLAIVE